MDIPEKYYKGREILEWNIETEEGIGSSSELLIILKAPQGMLYQYILLKNATD